MGAELSRMGLVFSLKRDPEPWQEGTGYEPGRGPSPKHDHADALISDFPPSEL